MILLALGNTIYAVVEYFHNEGGIAQIVSGILFVITFLVVYFETKRKKTKS